MKNTIKVIAITGLIALPITQANAASIAVNFTSINNNSNQNSGGTIRPVDSYAGAVVQSNWNNSDGKASGAFSDIIDDSGTSTAVQVSWASSNSWFTRVAPGDSDTELMSQYLDDYQPTHSPGQLATGAKVSITNVQYEKFDLYVYLATDQTFSNDTINAMLRDITNTTIIHPRIYTDGVNPNSNVQLIQDTANSRFNVTQGSNYIVFEGLTLSEFVIAGEPRAPHGSAERLHRATIAGFQIVEVPEPASIALLSLGGLALLKRKQK